MCPHIFATINKIIFLKIYIIPLPSHHILTKDLERVMAYSFKIRYPCSCTKIPTKTSPALPIPYPTLQPKVCKTRILAVSSSSSSKPETQEISISSTTKEAQQLIKPSAYDVKFKTMGGCKLGISRYPDFEYNAEGGFGSGSGSVKDDTDGEMVWVSFDVGKLYIPSLTSGTTKFLGLPLPPFLRIDIVPEILEGSIYKDSGKVDLAFKAKFWFSIGTIYKAPPLLVTTNLTSEGSEGEIRKGRGKRMDKNGECQLVGVARVDPINDILMDTFLSLPTECLALLNATLSLE
ncbi:uncharacterized protein LOC141617986 [Silene latifolia]|uniref:uncharacterized protein LOC141617986 n=1 Tax=Silene latifolia TaxID=37657 RepID=UPI003D76BEE5